MCAKECISITTHTSIGQRLWLRDFCLADLEGLISCVREPGFSYPLLTGTPDPILQPSRPLRRSLYYALVCKLGNSCGPVLFGKRRHWIISILSGREKSFLGVVLLDEVMRENCGNIKLIIGDRFLKHSEQRLPLRTGDGELGFFLHPRAQKQGIALQAAYVLLDCLSLPQGLGSNPILRRVWAETGTNNLPAKKLLRKMGLMERPEFAVSPGSSRRYERDGTPIGLVHFDQPDSDEQTDSHTPIRVRLTELVEREVVCPNWSFCE
jgi:RimJ/RimL family protein N-acetyltransferase